MVTLSQLRTQVGDRPQLYPPAAAEPEILGYGDGTNTVFGLSYENFVPGSLVVFLADPPTTPVPIVFTAVAASQYTLGTAVATASTSATNQVVTFTAAPYPGQVIAARYQATAFSDADLASYLSRAQALYGDDRTVLKAAQYDVIDAILSDQRRFEILAQGDYRRDATAYARNLLSLKASLYKDLEGGPTPGANTPAIGYGNLVMRSYTPYR